VFNPTPVCALQAIPNQGALHREDSFNVPVGCDNFLLFK